MHQRTIYFHLLHTFQVFNKTQTISGNGRHARPPNWIFKMWQLEAAHLHALIFLKIVDFITIHDGFISRQVNLQLYFRMYKSLMAGGVAAATFVTYCFYFDYKRRSHPLYKTKLREKRRQERNEARVSSPLPIIIKCCGYKVVWL